MDNKNSIGNVALGCFGLIGFALIIMVVSTIVNGMVLAQLWQWFVVTAFNVPSLSIAQAIGVAMVFGFFLRTVATNDSLKSKKDIKDFGDAFVMLIRALIIVLFGAGMTLLLASAVYYWGGIAALAAR